MAACGASRIVANGVQLAYRSLAWLCAKNGTGALPKARGLEQEQWTLAPDAQSSSVVPRAASWFDAAFGAFAILVAIKLSNSGWRPPRIAIRLAKQHTPIPMDNRHILPNKINGFFHNGILVGFTFENAPNVIARRVDYRDFEILFGHRILLRPGSGIWHVWRSFSTLVKVIKFQTWPLPIGGLWRDAYLFGSATFVPQSRNKRPAQKARPTAV
jgi:hypothetical protein